MSSEQSEGVPAAPPRRGRRTTAEIMERLITAAGAEFAESGYAATTAAIARRADVTEAQLFRYFPSKADLFQEAVFKPMEEHIRRFADDTFSNNAQLDNQDRARIYISELQDFLRRHSRMLMSLLVARAYSPSSQADGGIDSLTRYFEQGSEMMVEGLGKNAEVDPRLMVRVSFAALLACTLMDDWLFPPGLADRETIDAAIKAFILNGITPPGSSKL